MLTEVNIADVVNNDNSNKIYGFEPKEFKGTTITFHGKNNILYLEEGLRFRNASIDFSGDNAVLYISSSNHWCHQKITMETNAACVIGHNVFVAETRPLTIYCGTGDRIAIGNDCLVASAVKIDTRHCKSEGDRNILIGSHVWLCQESTIGGNTVIKGGAVLGANAVVSDEEIPKDTIYVTRNGKNIIHRENIAFTRESIRNTPKANTCDHDTISEEHLADIKRIASDSWDHVMENMPVGEISDKILERLLLSEKMRMYTPHYYENKGPKRSVRSSEEISLMYAGMKGLRVNKKSNTVIGNYNTTGNCKLTFKGIGNVIIFEDGVCLHNTKITFVGDNSIVYIRKSNTPCHALISIHTDCNLYIGENTEFSETGKIPIISVSEARSVIIGKNCKIGKGVYIRSSDQHPIYDMQTRERINPPQDVIVGDNIELKDNTFVSKGRKIGLGNGLFKDRYERCMNKLQTVTDIDKRRIILWNI